MSPAPLPPWSQVVHLHPDVEAGDTAVATYAIDLGALVAGDKNVPRVYRHAADFFAATYLTSGLRRLLHDVLEGLSGGQGDRVLQLRSPFGGGKSHTLAALYHAANDRAPLAGLSDAPGAGGLSDPGPVRIAVFDGEKFDVQGREVNGHHPRTLWGLLAAQLDCYALVDYHDHNRVPPGGDVIAAMLRGSPTLLLLDEVLTYLERVLAEPVGDSTLGRLTQDFLQTLSVEVVRTPGVVLVYSLQASAHEAFGNAALLQSLDHLTARLDAKREPVAGDEILPVLRRRLLAKAPDPAVAAAVAEVMAEEITRMRAAHAVDEAARREAEDDRLALRDRIAAAYPFHPALIDIMRERWASLPDFQRTRGALRFLSVCLHTLKRDGRAGLLLGPGDIAVEDGDVAQALFTEVGQREPFKAVLERDFYGPNARVKRIDDRLAREHLSLSGVHPAMRIATAVLAYSFGGLARPGEEGGEPMASGVGENELLAAVVGPGLDSLTAQAVMKSLPQQCLFLHYDGASYVFKTTPNITQVLEDQAFHVKPPEIEAEIEQELRDRLAGRPEAILWPAQSDRIPDKEARFLLAYLPLDFALQGTAAQEQQAIDYMTHAGATPRHYRNGLGLAVPEPGPVDTLRRATRYLLAAKRVRKKRQSLNLTATQMQQLDKREGDDKVAFESAVHDLYQAVWLLRMEGGQIGLDRVSLANRALHSRTMHERLMELLTELLPPRLFKTVTPGKIVELMQLGQGPAPALAAGTGQIVESFFRVVGFPRLASEAVLRRAIADGVQAGVFGYVGSAGHDEVDRLKESGGYLVNPQVVRLGPGLSEQDVDLSSAFIILPQAIRPATVVTGQASPSGPPGVTPGPQPSGPMPPGLPPAPVPAARKTTIHMTMRLTHQQLYASVNALANLADRAGSIRVSVEATDPNGFDPTWLHNAVEEPLDEADVSWG